MTRRVRECRRSARRATVPCVLAEQIHDANGGTRLRNPVPPFVNAHPACNRRYPAFASVCHAPADRRADRNQLSLAPVDGNLLDLLPSLSTAAVEGGSAPAVLVCASWSRISVSSAMV